MKRWDDRLVWASGLTLTVLLAAAACGSASGPATAPASEPAGATPSPSPAPNGLNLTGDVTIIYLGHCGYAVWTGRRLFIFDYSEFYEQPPAQRTFALGYVNAEEMRDLEVTVFVTHNHLDHYDPVIFTWPSVVSRIQYVYGWPAFSAPGHHGLGPRATLTLDGIEIWTVFDHHDDTDEAAFLVRADGLVVFHGGDYQGRVTPSAPMTVQEDMRYLVARAGRPDLAFLGAWTGDSQLQTIQGLDPRVIFPMHYGGQEARYAEFAADLRARGFAQQVVCPARRGDRYVFRNGQVETGP